MEDKTYRATIRIDPEKNEHFITTSSLKDAREKALYWAMGMFGNSISSIIIQEKDGEEYKYVDRISLTKPFAHGEPLEVPDYDKELVEATKKSIMQSFEKDDIYAIIGR